MSSHHRELFRLALPLVLSSSTVTVMQVIDAVVLARHSHAAVAAMGAGGLSVLLVQSLLFGTAGYTSVFCAHAHGARDAHGVIRGAWMGIHVAWGSGILLLFAAWPLGGLFHWVGHAPQVACDEATYFRILVAATFLPTLSAALSGWLSGQGRTLLLTGAQILGFAVNAILAWTLVLGRLGLPRLGMAGAAWATVVGQMTTCLILVLLFVKNGGVAAAGECRAALSGMARFLALAIPQGARISVEILAWTVFLFFVGRLGVDELAASTIAFRINGMAFFPLVGLGQAAGILAGQARGAGKEFAVPEIGWQALLLGEAWMLAFVALFLTFPRILLGVFVGTETELLAMGSRLLRYVAAYSVFDAANVILAGVLSSLGDTRWTLRLFLAVTFAFLAGMALADGSRLGLDALWGLATVYVFVTATAWCLRFKSGAWRRCRVTEA